MLRFFLITCLILAWGQVMGAPRPHFVVVAPKAFEKTLQPYLNHKENEFQVEYMELEKTLKKTPGVDDPEKLKRALFQRWSRNQLDYVLLVGDGDVLPIRYMCLDRITPEAFDFSFYPSDLYYADLAKPDRSFENWNASTNGFHQLYFGEVRGEKNKRDSINFDGVDYKPEVAMGRWPVSTVAELSILVEKTLVHEKNQAQRSTGVKAKAGLISIGGWVDTRYQMDQWGTALGENWQLEKRYYADRRRNDRTPPTNEKEIVQLMNEGAQLVIHTGHGESWCWHESLSIKGIEQLKNNTSLPVVVSAGCTTAYFAPLPPYESYVDIYGVEHVGTYHGQHFKEPPPPPSPYQKGKYDPQGLGEQLLKGGPHGAIAYIGCNTGSQPCGLTLVEGFVKATGQGTHRLGDAWKSALLYYHEKQNLPGLKPVPGDWYPPTIFFQGMKFMVFGDPTLKIR